MRTLSASLAIGVCLMAAAACDRQPEFKPVANVDQLMDATITPAAEIYWDSVSTTITKEGIDEKFPKTDEEWEAVWGAAMTIAESGNLLMMSPRAKDTGDWMQYSQQLVDVGMEAAKAAEGRRPDDVLAAGEKVYDVCTRCHMQYIVEEETP